MTITDTTTVADIASAIPSSVRIFERHGIDFCCGGKIPLASACKERGVPFAAVARAIEEAAVAAPPEDRDWNTEPLHRLADHIVATYHDSLRDELPRLASLAAKVRRVHGANAPYLARLDDVVADLSGELQSHMRKEELVLFPAIRAIEGGQAYSGPRIDAPITVMEHEHDHAGALAELRTLTGGYEPPAWACATFRALCHGLAELEADMHVHVHLENNVLFPRALAAAGLAA